MEFGLLGPVFVRVDGNDIELGPRKRRLLLALLVLELGRVVPVDRLVDLMWDEDPPQGARRVVFAHISRLRQTLSAAGASDFSVRLETVAPGYVLHADPDCVDLLRFQRLVETARKAVDPAERAAGLREALALWRGETLADVADPDLRDRVCRRYEDLRVAALEDRLEAESQTGGNADLVPELAELVARHPLRERLVGLLMLTLYRSSRQAEALSVYQELRQRLVDELGIDPGPELTRRYESILRNDPALLMSESAAPVRLVPGQLPADVAGFSGRTKELKVLESFGSSAGLTIALITGSAGIGKTALAVHWAHQIRGSFPDGQLYTDLRGYSPSPPLRPIEALAGLLTGLGVSVEEIPVDLTQAAALYRSRLADKQVLVVLDNAASPDQIRPLLPGDPRCLVVVTSRDRLGGLIAREGARRVDLQVFSPSEAIELLSSILGVVESSDLLDELAGRCAYLPLALRIAAANVLETETLQGGSITDSIAGYLRALDSETRLTALEVHGDESTAVRMALDLSYQKMPDDAQVLFRRLGLVPGPDWTLSAAAALAGLAEEEARRLLNRLLTAHLLEQPRPGRYTAHDLLRDYARERSCADDTESEREAARRRLLDWYLAGADAASRTLNPGWLRLTVKPDISVRPSATSEVPPMDWLDAERPNLIAAVRHAARLGPKEFAWLLADALRAYFALNRRSIDWLDVAQAALSAAESAGDLRAQSAAHLSLAQAQHRGLDNWSAAVAQNKLAYKLAVEAGWDAGAATALGNLGNSYRAGGELGKAADCYSGQLSLEQADRSLAGQGLALTSLGVLHFEWGQLSTAVEYFEQALTLRRAAGYRAGAARTLCFLGEALYRLGKPGRAKNVLEEAVEIFRDVGERVNEAAALGTLALVSSSLDSVDAALGHARTALTILREVPSRRIESYVLNALATISRRRGQLAEAVGHRERALALTRESRSRYQEAEVLIELASDYASSGRRAQAASCVEAARVIIHRSGYAGLANRLP